LEFWGGGEPKNWNGTEKGVREKKLSKIGKGL